MHKSGLLTMTPLPLWPQRCSWFWVAAMTIMNEMAAMTIMNEMAAITDNVIHMSSCSAVCIRYNCSLARVWHNTSPLPAVLRGQTWYILSHHLKTQITPLGLRSKCEVICEPVNWAISWYSINSGNADSESRRVASWQPLHQILDLPISGSEFVNGAY